MSVRPPAAGQAASEAATRQSTWDIVRFSAVPPRPADSELDQLPPRVFRFLRGIGTSPEIRGILSQKGYTHAVHDEGWRLLLRASGHPLRPGSSRYLRRWPAQLRELGLQLRLGVRVLRAALGRQHPDLCRELLAGVSTRGSDVLFGARTLIERFERLEQDDSTDARAALQLLEERGFGAEQRGRMQAILADLDRPPSSAPPLPLDPDSEQRALEASLSALQQWFEAWSEVARQTISQRTELTRLGLTERSRA